LIAPGFLGGGSLARPGVGWFGPYDDGMSEEGVDDGGTRKADDSSGGSLNPDVARDLSELSRELEAESDSSAVMQRILQAAVDEIGGAVGAAITLLEHGQLSSPAHSSEQARAVGVAESETGEGPCVDTSRHEVTLRSDDLRDEPRWPKWAAAAVENGVLSAMSFQLFVEGDSMGALDVFGDHPNAFDEEAENTGLLLASHAAIAMASTRQVENMQIAIDNRDLIGQAKGILMERYKIRAGQAFDLIVASSRATHKKVRVVADQLVATGELPLPPRRRPR
jgi:GAF domain-containing protein